MGMLRCNKWGHRRGVAIAYVRFCRTDAAASPYVILNLVQDPFLTIDDGLFGKMDPETSSG